jgi:hypothetical protein
MKRLSLFDQLKTRLPIRARIVVRRSADFGAMASMRSKSGFGGSEAGMRISADVRRRQNATFG